MSFLCILQFNDATIQLEIFRGSEYLNSKHSQNTCIYLKNISGWMPIEILCHIKQINFPFQLITVIFQHSFHPLLDNISISQFFSTVSSFLLTDPSDSTFLHYACLSWRDFSVIFSTWNDLFQCVWMF